MNPEFLSAASHPFLARKSRQHFIGGAWVEPANGKRFPVYNPANGEQLAEVAVGSAQDVDQAVNAARTAFEGPWRDWKPYQRQALLLRLATLVERDYDALAALDTLDMGAPIARVQGIGLGSVTRPVGLLRYYAGLATDIHGETIENSTPGEFLTYTLKEPIGVVAAIIPWNAPLNATIWKIAPALATGCTVVLKPSEEAPLSPLRFAELCEEAGVPAGVVNIVTGDGQTGALLAAHKGVDKVAFTGSNVTGQKIIEASAGNIKRVSLELGGKSPNIVFADADLDQAVPGAAMAVFANAGQICSAGTRLYVERSIYQEFIERVAAFAGALRVGSGVDPKTQIGPIVSARQLARVQGYLDKGVQEGAKLIAGGARLDSDAHRPGYFMAPTVFADVKEDMTIAREEIFGPVISAIPFDSFDEVVGRANDTDFGLGSGIWTRDIRKATRFARRVRAGSVWVNCYQTMDPAVPFGGYKQSGYGRESGRQHMEEFLEVKSVWINVT